MFLIERSINRCIKDLIDRGGYNVHAPDVEEVIHEIPGVIETAVVGRRDQRLGEKVVAFLVRESSSQVTAGQVVDHCKSRLSPINIRGRSIW